MVEANYLHVEEPTEAEEKILAWQPLTFDRFVRQKSGMKAAKQRKRQEKQLIKKTRHNQKGRDATLILKFHTDKRQKVSDQIQRGFDIATKWRNENVDKPVE